ncbi:MAG TPA: neutral/alkaline non-lysosomal ceramidase N-terminal domain-containing protein [Gemmatimonadaceae bacterium]|nr:neutral/alkaline non-lysosomal ceramidase N-terminal domain-containing protein [Gemmatimonadaceae bacterium]
MNFTNAFGVDVLLFVYDIDDARYFNVMRDPSLHLSVLANDEMLVPNGQTVTLQHTRDASWLVGVKRAAGFGRFEPFIAALTGQVYDATSRLELTAAGTIVWLNAPTIDVPTPRLTEKELNQPLPPARGHVVGVGRANITDMSARDPASQLAMQGWADSAQASRAIDVDEQGRELPLQARAFIVGDPASGTRAVFVVVDIWSCSIAIKQEVVRRLSYGSAESPYRHDNIFIAGTHTHSAPAGYLHHFLYNATGFGFDPHVFESVVSGIVYAVELAHQSLAEGRVWVTQGRLNGITRNRSMPAFANNPPGEIAAFPTGVDETMTLLAFEHESPAGSGSYTPIGLLNWFAIHTTNMGKQSTRISGDNKGWASHVLEQKHGPAFVAGFANGCAGDVSGNFIQGMPGFDSVEGTNFQQQRDRMIAAGNAQAMLAQSLLDRGGATLTGPVTAIEYRVNLPLRTGAPGALGLSMSAGSVEDGGPGVLPEGITLLDITTPTNTSLGDVTAGALLPAVLLPLNRLLASVSALLSGNALSIVQSALTFTPVTDAVLLATHFPKPILLTPGMMHPDPWVPDVVPLQLVRMGQFAVLGVPAEVTTVAGRRLQQAAAKELNRAGVETTAVSTYTNGYAQYITTAEEYDTQQYEGASTLYGRSTCEAVVKATVEIARAVTGRSPVVHDGPLADLRPRVITKRRMTFRNDSRRAVRFRLYLPRDVVYLATMWGGADFTVAPGTERAIVLPFPWSLFVDMVQVVWGSARISLKSPPKQRLFVPSSDLVLVQRSGAVVRSAYFPSTRAI